MESATNLKIDFDSVLLCSINACYRGGVHLFDEFLFQSDTYWIDNLPSELRLIVNACFPITSKSWWFITSYVLLFFLIPVLNCFVNSLENNGFVWVFVLLAFIWYATTVFNFAYVDIQRAVFFYIAGAWVKRNNIVFNKWVALLVFAISWLVFVGCDMISTGIVWYGLVRGKMIVKFLESIEVVFCVPVAVLALFSFFRACRVRESYFINLIASTTFGIYLFHDSSLNRQLIWDGILHTLDKQYESCFFPFFAVLSVVLVFGCCSVIDLVRQHVFERKVLPFLGNKIKKMFQER